MNDDVFFTKASQIVELNKTNPDAADDIAAVEAAYAPVQTAMSMPEGDARVAALALFRPKLEQLFDDLADTLEKKAAGDMTKLVGKGFDQRKDRSVSNEAPEIPQNLRAKTAGTSGDVMVLMDAPARAKSIQIQIATDPNGTWTDYDTFSSSRGIVIKGQPRAKDIWVRARSIGPNNIKSGWSDPATMLVV